MASFNGTATKSDDSEELSDSVLADLTGIPHPQSKQPLLDSTEIVPLIQTAILFQHDLKRAFRAQKRLARYRDSTIMPQICAEIEKFMVVYTPHWAQTEGDNYLARVFQLAAGFAPEYDFTKKAIEMLHSVSSPKWWTSGVSFVDQQIIRLLRLYPNIAILDENLKGLSYVSDYLHLTQSVSQELASCAFAIIMHYAQSLPKECREQRQKLLNHFCRRIVSKIPSDTNINRYWAKSYIESTIAALVSISPDAQCEEVIVDTRVKFQITKGFNGYNAYLIDVCANCANPQ